MDRIFVSDISWLQLVVAGVVGLLLAMMAIVLGVYYSHRARRRAIERWIKQARDHLYDGDDDGARPTPPPTFFDAIIPGRLGRYISRRGKEHCGRLLAGSNGKICMVLRCSPQNPGHLRCSGQRVRIAKDRVSPS